MRFGHHIMVKRGGRGLEGIVTKAVIVPDRVVDHED
jgi:hypothetical protein